MVKIKSIFGGCWIGDSKVALEIINHYIGVIIYHVEALLII